MECRLYVLLLTRGALVAAMISCFVVVLVVKEMLLVAFVNGEPVSEMARKKISILELLPSSTMARKSHRRSPKSPLLMKLATILVPR